MKHFYTKIKAFMLGGMILVGCSAFGQIKVNYNALPDYDKVPPVNPALGIPGGNAKNANIYSAKSRSANATDEQLPDHWNNALFKHFPPYFNQAGPSCMCSSFVGYIFTHELNSYRDLEGEKPENQMAVFFSWLQTFQNTDKESFELYNGCPNSIDYEGRTNSEVIGYYDWRSPHAGWMQGYDKWYRAMFNRAEGHYTFPLTVAKEEGRLATKRWVYNHNGDTDFKSGGLCYVTLASSGRQEERVASTPANLEAGAVGKYYIKKWGLEVDHAMTIIGWDDRLEFDFNDNGIYGEESADEKGAWIVANSWGEYWDNGGWTYVPYRYAGPVGSVAGNYFWQPYVTYIRKDYVPNRTLKLLMDYSHRNELFLRAGVSADTAAKSPAYMVDMSAFKNAGNGLEEGGYPEVPMLGMYVDGMHYEPMEFGYDLTDISNGFDLSQPLKYFFTVNVSNGLGTGHIYKASIMDYRFDKDKGVEIPFNIDTVVIGKDGQMTATISVVVPGESVNSPLNATLNGNTLSWDAPNPTTLKVKKYFVYKNNVCIDSIQSSKTSYTIDDASSTYCVTAAYACNGLTIESAKSNMAYVPAPVPTGDNMTMNINQGCMIVPNAITNKLNEGTIEFMIKPNEIGGHNHRICGSKDKNFFFEISASGQVVTGWTEKDKVASAAKVVKANTWHHVAIVVQQNTLTLYINGMKKGSMVATTNSGIPAIKDLVIGEDNNFNAEIDELRIWKKARVLSEIYSSKDIALASPAAQPDLIAYLPMNLIEVEGEERVQEFVCNNHAYLYSGNIENLKNTSILNASAAKINPSITLGDSIYTNQPYQLNGTGNVSIVDWKWSTPGATVETHNLQSPYVTYTAPGTYTVSMTTVDRNGTELTTEKEIKVVTGTLPQPEFDMSATRLGTAEPFSFVNRTKGGNCTYVWSTDETEDIYMTNANIAFNVPGPHSVTLTATNSAGSASITKTVEVYKSHPVSKFNIAPDHIYLGETTYLEDKSTGDPTSWIWTLSNGKRYLQVNGQFSSLTPPAPGIYDVSLQTFNSAGSNIATKTRSLYVSNADAKNGLVFAGNDEMLEIDRPFKEDQTVFSIDWWMNPSAFEGAGGFSFGDLYAKCTDKGLYTITYNGKTYNAYLPITNQWHHYALVFNAGTITIYRDAVLFGTFNATSVYTKPSWPDKFIYGRSDNPFSGYIDEMRIWSTALNPVMLKAFSNRPIENPTSYTPLCVYYDFNQNGGDVIDRTGHGYDAKRVNFGPDGDAWIVSPGVFTLDLNDDIVTTDVTSKYMTNYKAPFIYNNVSINNTFTSAKELQTETEKSTWIFKSPRKVSDDITSAVYVDADRQYQLGAYTSRGFGKIYNQRLYQTVTLPQGHYRFSISSGSTFYPANSKLVVCYGDSIVTNETINEALVSALLSNKTSVEFDVAEDNTNVSLGVLYNIPTSSSYYCLIKEFKLTEISSTSKIADGVSDFYDAVNKGQIGTFSAEVGAVRIVSPEIIEVKIYNTTGQCVFNEYVSGSKRIPLQPGVYVVNGQKLLVK